jgi:hypothetical protein
VSNTLAELLLRERLVLSQGAFVEIGIWRALQADFWRAVSKPRRGK